MSNVVLITIDSLRFDHVSKLGYNRQTTPSIDRLAENGVLFSNAVANASSTPSSFPSILTSTHALMYGGYHYLSQKRPFIASKLLDSGYYTVGFHSNPHLGQDHNYDAGFQSFNDTAEGSESVASLKDRVERRLDPNSPIYGFARRLWHYFTMTTDTSAYAKAPTITGDALTWLNDEWDEGEDFFMWLHYMDAHYPFTPTDKFFREIDVEPLSTRRVADLNGKMQEDPDALNAEDVDDLLKLYDAEIRFCDHHLERVFDALRDRGIFEESIIILTADHGEGFGEHDRFGHHPYLYDELLRVPLIVRAPGIDPSVVDQQVSLVDVGPTIYDLLGIETPENVQGTSFKPLLHGDEMTEPVALVTAADGKMLACRTSKWKCFWRVEEGTVELYDLENDPSESNDVSENHHDVVDEFVDEMEAYLDAAEMSEVVLPEVREDESVKQRLRDLGYSE